MITHRLAINGIETQIYEWREPIANQPSLIFFHATGFHGRCWDVIIEQLEGYHCYAVDAAGHGASEQPNLPHTWHQYGADATEIVRRLRLKDAVGVGHSKGGNMLVRAASNVLDAFCTIILLDPVIMPRELYTLEDYSIEGHFVLSRRTEWDSVEAMIRSYRGRGPFANWEDRVLVDYCTHGVVQKDGHVQLACPPALEAHIYMGSLLKENVDVYDGMEKITYPAHVLRFGDLFDDVTQDMLASPTAPNLAAQFNKGRDTHFPDYTHFMPMEAPDTIAQYIRDVLI